MATRPTIVFNDGIEGQLYNGDGPAALEGRSPNGHRWQITINDSGTLTTTDLDA